MEEEAVHNGERTVPLYIAFGALQALSNQSLITGLDNWRLPTDRGSLSVIDPELAHSIQKQPPSKFGHTKTPSLWTATHFYVALPVLSYALKMYGAEDETTREMVIGHNKLKEYLPAFPYILRHYREYEEMTKLFGQPTEAWWTDTLSNVLPDTSKDTLVGAQLAALHPYLRDKATLVLSGEGNSITGRIVLAYLLGGGTRSEQAPIDARIHRYLEPIHDTAPAQTLYERLVIAFSEIAQLDPYLRGYNPEQGLRLRSFLDIVAWYGRPHLVEMMLPGLTGAAEATIRSMSTLFADIVKEGGPDYTAAPIASLPAVQKFFSTQSLETIGRLSIAKDILTHESKRIDSDGSILRALGQYLYTDTERKRAWGNGTYYIPDTNRSGFTTFRQDIANILYCAALFAESSNMAGTVNPDALRHLAEKVTRARTLNGIRKIIHTDRAVLDSLAIDWEIRFAGHERLRLLRLVREAFGLDTIKPIPIPLVELNKGFSGSYYDGHVYHLRYQEAGEKLEMALTINAETQRSVQVRYCTLKEHEPTRITSDGLPYSAWLEVTYSNPGKRLTIVPVPGRGSFDPFGIVGSLHAGEVIGFGCSVHHASLAIILAELASLGASRRDLERVTAAFMRINHTVHERYDFAAFQLEQIIAAFENESPYTYREYILLKQGPAFDTGRPHVAAYARIGRKSLAWAELPAARLAFGYPTLYPTKPLATVSPRQSWYDGHPVELPDAVIQWQVLTC